MNSAQTLRFLLLGLLCIPLLSMATILRVNNTPEAGVSAFACLQDAIYSASTIVIDTIIVEHSDIPYDCGQPVIVSRNVRIYGTGYFLEDNDCTQADTRVAQIESLVFTDSSGVGGPSAAGSVFAGLQVGNIEVRSSQVRIFRCLVTEYLGVGTDGNVSNVMIYQNFFRGDVDSLLSVVNCSNFIVRNNVIDNLRAPQDNNVYNMRVHEGTGIVLNNLFYGEQKSLLKNATVQNNQFRSELDAASSNLTVQNNYSETTFLSTYDDGGANNNIFNLAISVDSLNCHTLLSGVSRDGEYQLNANWDGSSLPVPNPAYGNAADGGNIGIMGGTDPYVLSGMPPIPSVAKYTGSASGTNSGGTTAVVKGKSRR